MIRAALATLLWMLASVALAQSPVTVIGPVTVGHVPQFSSPTVLKDSGVAAGGRTILNTTTTFYRRSDGNNANCTALVDAPYVSGSYPQACASKDWNIAYSRFASNYDAAGGAITLKSGTQDTATSGLFMSAAWVGGGSLIIDLNGSNIAETVTKGVINDVVQPGQITLQNSAGLGVGGNISSAGFSCIQNDQASDFNIGVGISVGPCFDAAFEAIQTGNIYLGSPVNVGCAGAASCSGREMFLTANNSNIGANGQAVNVTANLTYSVGTVVAQFTSDINVAGTPWNLGGHTVAGPRYSVNQNGYIYTGNAGPTFIPGSTAGALVSDSGGCYDLICYQSIADATPMLGSFLATAIAAPATPPSGKLYIWADLTDLTLKSLNSFGSITTMVFPQAASGNLFVTGLATSGGLLTAQPTFSNLATGTAPAFTLGGTVSGGGNQINNVVIGTSTPLAGTFTTLTANTSISSPIHTAPGALSFQSNGSTAAGVITTAQRWGFGSAAGAQVPTNTQVVISQSATTIDAATPGLTPLLHLVGANATIPALIIDSFGSQPGVGFRGASGTAASPTVVVSNSILGSFFGLGYDASGSKYGYSGEIDFFATETWSSTAHGGGIKFWSVPNTTTTQTQSMTLQNSGGLSIGTTADPGIGSLQLNAQFFMPNITQTSAAQTGTVCWTTGTGKFTVDTTVGCLTSLLAAKDVTERLSSAKALDIVTRLDPFAFRYKKGWGDSGRYEQFGLGAEEVAEVDERLVGRDPYGALQGVRYQELGAVLVGAIKELKAEVQQMRGGR